MNLDYSGAWAVLAKALGEQLPAAPVESSPIEEPELNSYHVALNFSGVKKRDVLALAEKIRTLAGFELPDTPLTVTVAHVKGVSFDV